MQNLDVTLELITRMDDSTLAKMVAAPALRDQITRILTDKRYMHDFWYRRTKHLVKLDIDDANTDWRDVYYSVLARKQREEATALGQRINWLIVPDPISELGLSDLVVYDILERMYGTPALTTREEQRLWTLFGDQKTLDNAIQLGVVQVTDANVDLTISTVLYRGQGALPLIERLLSLLSTPEIRRKKEEQILLTNTILEGQTELVKAMLERVTDQSVIDGALVNWSTYRGKPETIQLLLDRVSDPDVIKQAIVGALQRGNRATSRMLIAERGVQPDELLQSVISYGPQSSLLALMDEYPDLPISQDVFDHAFAREWNQAIVRLLSDPHIDPMANLEDNMLGWVGGAQRWGQIGSSFKLTRLSARIPGEEAIDALIRSPRVDIERLDTETLEMVLWSVQAYIADRIRGVQRAREIAGAAPALSVELEDLLKMKGNIHSKLARYIILTRPRDVQLLDWMIAQNDREFILAANDVLNDVLVPDYWITPIWALLSILLYPTLTLQRLVDRMRTSGVEQHTIVASAELIGAYLDPSRLL